MRKKILLVEDEAILAMTERKQLEKYGYAVDTVNTGEKAVEVVSTTSDIDLILMDINLGDGMDGTEAAELILHNHDVPIVFVSSHTEPEIVEKTEKITSYGYVVKNSSITVLDASIKMAFKLFDAKNKELEKEKLLQKSEEKYRLISENTSDGIVHFSPEGLIDYVSPAYLRQLGFSEFQELGRGHGAIRPEIHPDDQESLFSSLDNAIVNKEKELTCVYRIKHANGHYIWREDHSSFMYDSAGTYLGAYVSCRDITDRKVIENKLIILGKAIEASPVTIVITDVKGTIEYVNPRFTAITGYSIEEVIGKNTRILKSGKTDEGVYIDLWNTLAEGNEWKGYFKNKKKSGEIYYESATIAPVKNLEGETTNYIAVKEDLTEKRYMQESLEESNVRFNTLAGSQSVLIWESGVDKLCSYFNPTWMSYTGRTLEQELGNGWLQGVHPDDLERCIRTYTEAFDERQEFSMEYRLRRANGAYGWILDHGSPKYHDHKFIGYLGSCVDISQNKNYENILRESEEKYRFALEGSNLGEWDWNLKSNEIKRNARWAEMLGYTPEELEKTLQQGIDLQHPDDSVAIWKAVQDHLEGKTDHYSVEYRMKTKSGTYKLIRDCGKIMERDSEGKPLRLCGTHADIDKFKNSDALIMESNRMLNSIMDSSPDVMVFALDTNYNYLAFNTMHKHVIKSIWGKDISIGTNLLDVIGNHEDGVRAKDNFDRALRGESFVVVEEYGDEKLSRQSWLDYWSPIKSLDGSIIGLTCFLMNNTKQKEAQDMIESLLAEKEIILKEVHHRIKNNMNTICSLLSLQAGTVNNSSAVLALQDAGNRIQSMALLYDKLYRSADYSEMSVNIYLSSLVDEVVANFPNSQMVELKKRVQDFNLDVKRLQPLGIIINELITNIMKYAFIGKDSGSISVSAIRSDDHITVSVEDDGVGMPESLSFENSTGFGLQLVDALTQQLNGTICIERGNGTKVVLEFDI